MGVQLGFGEPRVELAMNGQSLPFPIDFYIVKNRPVLPIGTLQSWVVNELSRRTLTIGGSVTVRLILLDIGRGPFNRFAVISASKCHIELVLDVYMH